jgi:pimeloyl-ACP methyl ester carboxylesterase
LRLIDGGADPVSGAHLYHYYKEQIPNADAVLLERVGHYPQTEAPQAVVKAFLEFHARLGTTRE